MRVSGHAARAAMLTLCHIRVGGHAACAAMLTLCHVRVGGHAACAAMLPLRHVWVGGHAARACSHAPTTSVPRMVDGRACGTLRRQPCGVCQHLPRGVRQSHDSFAACCQTQSAHETCVCTA
eukprot:365069-Chlamydomonas_euryale.AAC.28